MIFFQIFHISHIQFNNINNIVQNKSQRKKQEQRMFGQFQTNQDHQDNKGLFTFYREQAEKQEQIRRLKKERKLAKLKQAQQKKRRQQEMVNGQQKQSIISKQFSKYEQGQIKIDTKTERPRKNLYEPKNKRQKYNKQQLGTSVVIVNSKQINDRSENENIQRSRSTLRKIQQMINPYNNNRYFLQNKEMPSSFGKFSIQKMIVKQQDNQNQQAGAAEKKNAIKPSYFNGYNGVNDQKKYIPTFSYEKLPQLIRNKPQNSQVIFPKRYKSKKIETALKSNNSELIKQIRESLRQQSILDRVSFIDANQGMISNRYQNSTSPNGHDYDQDYQNRLNSQLDAKQRRLIQIIRNSSLHRSKKMA